MTLTSGVTLCLEVKVKIIKTCEKMCHAAAKEDLQTGALHHDHNDFASDAFLATLLGVISP